MCGRFTLRTPQNVLIEHFDLEARGERQLPLFGPRYNIAPTQDVLIIRASPTEGARQAALVRWGLIPSWSKQNATGPPLINARSETLAEKPAFRGAYRARRCLIPSDGFYEWKQSAATARGKKQPYYIRRPDGAPFAFAGLWETWSGPSPAHEKLTLESCTIVTTAATQSLRELHDRMPVILAPGDYSLWLDRSIYDPAKLQHLLAPAPDEELVAEPVSTHVNRVANDDARCIAAERSLFE